jgi:hypothetical protein
MTSSCSSAVSEGSRLDCWKTMPMLSRRRAAVRVRPRVEASTSSIRTRPESGAMRAEATASRLDLPEPLGPVIAVIVPRSTARLAWSMAVTKPSPSGKVRVMSSRRIMAVS